MALLEVDDLRTQFYGRYGRVHAVDGVSFTLDAGRTLAIVGESGCGKSATALSIMRLLPGRSAEIVGGAVRFGGRTLTTLRRGELENLRGSELAMIFQDPMTSLNPTLTIGAQIVETLRRHLGLGKAEAERRAVGLDDGIMRVTDAVLAIPIVLLALSVLAVVGGGIRNLILVIAFTQWMTYARTARAETLALREQDYVRAAKAIGARSSRILRRHILPHLMPSAIALATLNVSVAILIEAGLSYLGLGVQPPDPSLGSMLTDGRTYMNTASWLAIYPGLALLLLILGINLLGDGLSTFLDPRAARRATEIKPL